ncbi:hypothetical protein V8E36_007580 [Tilletia maclaganii]
MTRSPASGGGTGGGDGGVDAASRGNREKRKSGLGTTLFRLNRSGPQRCRSPMTSSKERTLTTVEGTAPPHKLAQVLTEGPLPQLLEPIRSIGSRSAFAAARGRRQVQGGSQSDSRADGEGAAYAQQHQPLSGLDYKAKSFGRQRVAQVCPFAALRQGLDVGLHAPTTTVIDIVLTLTFARSGRQSADIRKSQQQAHLVSHLYGTLACRAEGPLVPAISGVTRQN